MSDETTKRVALVTVGDELLAGDTVNTNAAWLGRRLTDLGSIVERVVVVPDRIEAIAEVIGTLRRRFDAVVVTGGLGPTHDDVTMEAVAEALDRPMEEHEEALGWLIEEGGYSHDELVEGTADLPAGATALHNEVGVAPGAIVDDVYVLPGVPAEMKAMFETVASDFEGVHRHVVELRTPSPESSLVEILREARDRFGVAVGSYPGEDVRIRLSGTDRDAVDRAATWLRERVEER